MAGGTDEIENAMDSGVFNLTVSIGGKLFAEVSAVLVLDVFDDGVPAEAG